MASEAPLMVAQDLWLRAGGLPVLQRVGFEVRRGEILVLMGPSGCGKSTLLRHLAGLERPERGQVLLQGQDLHAGSSSQQQALRRRLGVMFQAGALWSSWTLGENLMLPLRMVGGLSATDARDRARQQLSRVGLLEAFDRLPAQLSGGMRKRAAFARALVLDPPLLLLDEPGSGLDPLNAARLDQWVLQCRSERGTTVVLVTHEIRSIFAVADRALYLDETQQTMTAIGPPAALLSHGPSAVRRFLQAQPATGGGL